MMKYISTLFPLFSLTRSFAEEGGAPPAEPPPADPPAVDFTQLIGADGAFSENFYGALPEDLGAHSSIKTIKTVPDLAKAFINTKSALGRKVEEFWTSEDPADVTRRNEVMGIPADKDGYEIKAPELPEGVPFDQQAAQDFRVKAKELGLTQAQTQALVDYDAERATTAFGLVGTMMEARKAEASGELREDWGNDFDLNLGRIKQATDYLGITDVLDSTGLGNEPAVLKAILEKIVPAISDDKLIEGAKADNFATLNDAITEVEGKMMEWDGASSDPKYQGWVREREALLRKMK